MRSLPGVVETTLLGAPCFKVGGRVMACEAIHSSAERNSLMVAISVPARSRLLKANPAALYLTDHYRPYPSLLIRLGEIDERSLGELLHASWRFVGAKPAPARRAKTPRTKN